MSLPLGTERRAAGPGCAPMPATCQRGRPRSRTVLQPGIQYPLSFQIKPRGFRLELRREPLRHGPCCRYVGSEFSRSCGSNPDRRRLVALRRAPLLARPLARWWRRLPPGCSLDWRLVLSPAGPRTRDALRSSETCRPHRQRSAAHTLAPDSSDLVPPSDHARCNLRRWLMGAATLSPTNVESQSARHQSVSFFNSVFLAAGWRGVPSVPRFTSWPIPRGCQGVKSPGARCWPRA